MILRLIEVTFLLGGLTGCAGFGDVVYSEEQRDRSSLLPTGDSVTTSGGSAVCRVTSELCCQVENF